MVRNIITNQHKKGEEMKSNVKDGPISQAATKFIID